MVLSSRSIKKIAWLLIIIMSLNFIPLPIPGNVQVQTVSADGGVLTIPIMIVIIALLIVAGICFVTNDEAIGNMQELARDFWDFLGLQGADGARAIVELTKMAGLKAIYYNAHLMNMIFKFADKIKQDVTSEDKQHYKIGEMSGKVQQCEWELVTFDSQYYYQEGNDIMYSSFKYEDLSSSETYLAEYRIPDGFERARLRNGGSSYFAYKNYTELFLPIGDSAPELTGLSGYGAPMSSDMIIKRSMISAKYYQSFKYADKEFYNSGTFHGLSFHGFLHEDALGGKRVTIAVYRLLEGTPVLDDPETWRRLNQLTDDDVIFHEPMEVDQDLYIELHGIDELADLLDVTNTSLKTVEASTTGIYGLFNHGLVRCQTFGLEYLQ